MAATGWGTGGWGSSPWGYGGFVPPTITPLYPVNGDINVPLSSPITFRLSDGAGVSTGALRVSVNGTDWVLYGVSVNGSTMTKVANAFNGFDVTVTPPTPYGLGTQQEVFISVLNIFGATAQLFYQFYAGVGLRLIQISNPMENVLVVSFNRSLALNGEFYFVDNWKVTEVSDGAVPLEIVEVVGSASQPDKAYLRYTGGGSTYLLTVYSLLGASGEPLEFGYDSLEFELLFGDEEAPTVRLFDSVYGPLGISQQVRRRRTMDEHTADRAIAMALDEQLRLRMQQLDGTIDRTGKPGIRRT